MYIQYSVDLQRNAIRRQKCNSRYCKCIRDSVHVPSASSKGTLGPLWAIFSQFLEHVKETRITQFWAQAGIFEYMNWHSPSSRPPVLPPENIWFAMSECQNHFLLRSLVMKVHHCYLRSMRQYLRLARVTKRLSLKAPPNGDVLTQQTLLDESVLLKHVNSVE